MRSRITQLGIAAFAVFLITISRNNDSVGNIPNRESAFLRQYTPQAVVATLRYDGFSDRWAEGTCEVGCTRSTTAWRTFEGTFAIPSAQCLPLMDAVRDDIATQLVQQKAKIRRVSGDSQDGFNIDYEMDNILGSVTIFPLQVFAGTSKRDWSAPGPPPATIPVTLKVRLDEKWGPEWPALE